ncbi:HNH endonuclease [Xylocopilactobacillus apicola]|uniref:Restriction endonuclease n=1 Tax=Xylocopilactobacillus apicola TaxID=2932184 RepID=A0AAU9DVG2_9LACO|nr:HNH endonuclease [Xylocopilactobacillus apicola]BDR59468.1 restriction endonuclease [Xylocopilactobacillus apicola]
MKLSCASCELRLTPEHFIKKSQVFSVCDVCQVRGLLYSDFYNYRNSIYAEVMNLTYQGGQTTGKALQLPKTMRKVVEAIISDYDDAAIVVKKNIGRRDLYERLIKYEDQEITLDNLGSFFDNLAQLGFQVDTIHNLQKIDYNTRMQVYHRFHNTCQYCGRQGMSIDHMKPVSSGGANDLDNLTLSCRECNKLKSNMPYEWFMEFNLQTKAINRRLVAFEQQINELSSKKEQLTAQLSAYLHRTGVVVDERSEIFRKQLKEQQILLDGLNQDYQRLRDLRKSYINARYQMSRFEKRER